MTSRKWNEALDALQIAIISRQRQEEKDALDNEQPYVSSDFLKWMKAARYVFKTKWFFPFFKSDL